MADISTVVDGYIAMWNETGADAPPLDHRRDVDRRRRLPRPAHVRRRPDGIDAMVAGAQQQFPGARFELTAGPDHHHDRVRFAWRMVGGDGGAELARGVDFATVADDGRLRSVTGFLEPGAAAE